MTTPRAASPADRHGFFRRHWGLTAVLVLVVLPIAGFALWTWITLAFPYSSGERTGYNQKFSHKGYVCKTWEGELAISNVPGQAPQLFDYSVRDERVAERIRQLDGQRVTLLYHQHLHAPLRCFGETDYFVDSVRVSAAAPFPGYGVPAAPAAPAVPSTPR